MPIPGHFEQCFHPPRVYPSLSMLCYVLRASSNPPTCKSVEHRCWLQQVVPLLLEGEEDADCSDDCKANAEDGNGCS